MSFSGGVRQAVRRTTSGEFNAELPHSPLSRVSSDAEEATHSDGELATLRPEGLLGQQSRQGRSGGPKPRRLRVNSCLESPRTSPSGPESPRTRARQKSVNVEWLSKYRLGDSPGSSGSGIGLSGMSPGNGRRRSQNNESAGGGGVASPSTLSRSAEAAGAGSPHSPRVRTPRKGAEHGSRQGAAESGLGLGSSSSSSNNNNTNNTSTTPATTTTSSNLAEVQAPEGGLGSIQAPASSSEPQDSMFCLDDENMVAATDAALHSFCISDPTRSGNPLVYVSSGFEAVTGYSREEVLGRNCKLLQGPDTDEATVATLKEAMSQKRECRVEILNYRKDGTPFLNLLHVKPVLDSLGNVTKFVAVQIDLSGQRRSEGPSSTGLASKLGAGFGDRGGGGQQQSLSSSKLVGGRVESGTAASSSGDADGAGGVGEESIVLSAEEQKLAGLKRSVSQLLGCITMSDPALPGNPLVFANEGFEHLTGFSSSDVLGMSCMCLSSTNSDVNKSAIREVEAAHKNTESAAVRVLSFKKSGIPFWCYLRIFPLWAGSSAASVQRFLYLHVDITASKTRKVGRYQLGRIIGRGASGTVRIARNVGTGDRVAVKIVDASKFRTLQEIERVHEEISILERIKHAHVIRLHEVLFINEVFYFVMEYAPGGSLIKHIYRQAVDGKEMLPEPEARRIFMQVLSALDCCHRRRIVHRDLKPENILLDSNNDVKIADFGLSTVISPFQTNGLKLACGTLEFTAVEILRGKEYSGSAIDVWSLGVILYEMLAGFLPFKGSTQHATVDLIKKGDFTCPDWFSRDVKELLGRMLEQDPSERITLAEIWRTPFCGGGDDDLDLSEDEVAGRDEVAGLAAELGELSPLNNGSANNNNGSSAAAAAVRSTNGAGGYDSGSPARGELDQAQAGGRSSPSMRRTAGTTNGGGNGSSGSSGRARGLSAGVDHRGSGASAANGSRSRRNSAETRRRAQSRSLAVSTTSSAANVGGDGFSLPALAASCGSPSPPSPSPYATSPKRDDGDWAGVLPPLQDRARSDR
mmetsp:Transcript_4907/g.17034  ORF Transcript_4907/g.17034 Transcript_4907/m.17034 type:complete len:1034 (+) Transcript_4907:88-3189(+)